MKIHLSNFTPVLDSMVDQYGLVTAMVYGAMMRFAQTSGICWASQETIAKRAGVSAKTVYRHEAILEAAGLIELVKHEAGDTLHYRVIDTMVIETAIVKDTESEVDRTQSPEGRTQSPTKIQIINNNKDHAENKDQFSARENPEPPAISYEPCTEEPLPNKNGLAMGVAQAISEVTGMSFPANKKYLIKAARELIQDERVTPIVIRRDYMPGGAWYKQDWRGKLGQKPKVMQIRETLFTFQVANQPKVIKGDVRQRS